MSYLISDKPHVQTLLSCLLGQKVQEVVLSPGSRNAPFIISFTQHPAFRTWTIPDERSAGFVALGMAQQTRQPVVLCCTSGSAVLNYAPAIVEAYYQKIPLIVITADRPEYLIDNGAGQSMRQQNVYANYIRASMHLSEAAFAYSRDREAIAQVLQRCRFPDGGPVHINVALEEPLYGQVTTALPKASVQDEMPTPPNDFATLTNTWRSHTRKLVLVGMHTPDPLLAKALQALAKDPSVVVWTENLANVYDPAFHPCIDRLMASFNDQDHEDFVPEVLLTIGDAIVSKWVKKWWRKYAPKYHFNITQGALHYDMFGCLTATISAPPVDVLTALGQLPAPKSDFAQKWASREQRVRQGHDAYLDSVGWSDLQVFSHLLQALPAASDLQLANSTPVRYAQLFPPRPDIHYFANRGVSGIDGTLSTAVGAALMTGRLVTVVTGDMGFFYDSNALWHRHWPENLRIIIINNGGGNIFRYISGPDTTAALEEYFEAQHPFTAEHIAATFGLTYHQVADVAALQQGLARLYEPQEPLHLLEIKTPGPENALILRQYFEHLKSYR